MNQSQENKVTVNEPFQLLQNQFEVIKELAEIEGEWIRSCVIMSTEMDIEHCNGGGPIGMGVAKRLKDKWT